MPAAAAASAVVPPIGASSRRDANDVREAEGHGESLRLLRPLGFVVQRERLERLDHVSAVQVDEHVARRDQLVEDVVREHLGERAVGASRESSG